MKPREHRTQIYPQMIALSSSL